jgi:hypothetical protein
LNRLFDVVHAVSEPAISNASAAEGITRQSGISISPEDLEQLRTGATQDVSVQQLAAIAEFFGVPPAYLTSPLGEPMIDAQLNLLEAMRDRGIRDLHSCHGARGAVQRQSPQAINGLATTIHRLALGDHQQPPATT